MKPWYNAERVAQPGSVILARVAENLARENAARRAACATGSPQAAVPVSSITRGTEMFDIMTGGYGFSGAGVAVTEQSAMSVSAVYACVSLIGGAIAALPFHLYKRTADGRERIDSDLWWLFNESPWDNWTAASAWHFSGQSIGLKGDAFFRIHRKHPGSLEIKGFEPTHPDRVQPVRTPAGILYSVLNNWGARETVEPFDMLHFPGIGFDGLRSMTPIRAALRPSAGIALAADEYAGAFFRNGGRPDYLIAIEGKMDPDQQKAFRASWELRYSGLSNAHVPAILASGGKTEVKTLNLNPEDAQLLTTRKFQVEDIARMFGVPPHMIGATDKATSWGAGIEQQSIGFVRYTLRRYIDAMQQEINRKVWPRSRINFGEFNVDALLDGDSKAQAEYFGKALGGPGTQGWMTVNEVRRLKNQKPIPRAWTDTVQRSATAAGASDKNTQDDPADPPAPEPEE